MLKISQAGHPNQTVTLKVEGRVVGPWVEELRRICDSMVIDQRELHLDLADVSYVDADGVATLTDFKSRGVKLENCSAFLEQQMKVPC
jgi:ABC-type transporter Mla MlaB component